MNRQIKSLFYFFFLLSSFQLSAQSAVEEAVYLPQTFEKNGQVLNYNIMYPHDFDKTKKYPLLLFLHGSGERGDDNKAQLVHGSKLFQDSLSSFPAVVVFPQCPREDYWVNLESNGQGSGRSMKVITDQGPTKSLQLVIDLMEQTLSETYIDKDRFYVTGLSMGGMGTIELVWRMQEKITAAIAICGVGPREKAKEMINVPFWFIHGVKDNVVPARYSRIMLESIQKAGGTAKITLYPEANHNSWDRAFANPKFLPFLFSKTR